MIATKVLNLLADLSFGVISAKAGKSEETKSQQTQAVTQEAQQFPLSNSLPTRADTTGYPRWGINE